MNYMLKRWQALWSPHPPLYKELFLTYAAYVVFVVAATPLFHVMEGKPTINPAENLPLFIVAFAIFRYRNKSHKRVFLLAAENLGILRRVNRYGMFLCLLFSIMSMGV